ncbi:MAG: GNAT family N-acetyltransferase [Flavobacterium sp.]|nr:GNAT family N-acetyltransferase [Flavobacterium sp.]
MNSFAIKKIGLDQLVPLQEIGRKTFYDTFFESDSEESMKTYLATSFSTQKLTAELENPNSEFYFATQNEAVIGYLKVNFGPAQTELQDGNSLEIERIYVLQDYHGKKVGQLLFEKAIAIAKDNSCSYVWLGVWEENHRALQFYSKNGFVAFDKHIFVFGDEAQTDIMMKLVL